MREQIEGILKDGAIVDPNGAVYLDEAVEALMPRLKAVAGIEAAIREAVGYGVTTVESHDEWRRLIATWILERQCNLTWNPNQPLADDAKSD